MVRSGHTRPSGSCCNEVNLNHWCQTVKQVIVRTFTRCDESITLAGGSDNGQFIYASDVGSDIEYADDVALENGDILLKIQEQKISGFTCLDAVSLLKYCCKNSSSLIIECVPCGEYLTILNQFTCSFHVWYDVWWWENPLSFAYINAVAVYWKLVLTTWNNRICKLMRLEYETRNERNFEMREFVN